MGVLLLGVSKDKVSAQEAFEKKQSLGYRLLADPKSEIIKKYDAAGTFGFAKRVTYVLDKDLKIIKTYPKVSPKDHAGEVLEDLKEHLK